MSSSTTNNAAQGTSSSLLPLKRGGKLLILPQDAPLSSNAPLADRMTQDTAGAIKPIAVTEREKKAERENDHHGAGSSL